MYLHLDKNILLPKGKILGIFELDNASWEKTTRDFLKTAEQEGRVVTACEDLPRSFVLVEEDFGNTTVYLSGRSSRRLKKRFEEHSFLGYEGERRNING